MTDDPGLQPQRTTLAWTRTAIGCGGLAALLVRHAVLTGRIIDVIAAVLAITATVSVLILGRRRRDSVTDRISRGQTPVTRPSVVTVAALIALLAVMLIGSILVDEFRS
jgi:uncharacterized membrane protein YidH (DUF202 family)